MKRLIRKNTLRLLEIAERVTLNPDGVTVNELVEINKCSVKTAYEDIKVFVELMNKPDTYFKNSTVVAKESSISRLIDFKKQILKDEIRFQLVLSILTNPRNDIYEHAVQLNCSESHVRNSITFINNFLKTRDLSIKYSSERSEYYFDYNNPMYLVHFITKIIIETNNQDLLGSLKPNEETLLQDFFERMNLNLSDYSKRHFRIFYLTQLMIEKEYEITIQGFKIFEEETLVLTPEIVKLVKSELKLFISTNRLNSEDIDFENISDELIYLSVKQKVLGIPTENFRDRFDFFYAQQEKQNKVLFLEFHQIAKSITQSPLLCCPNSFNAVNFILHQYLEHHISKTKNKIAVYSDLGKQHSLRIIDKLNRSVANVDITIFNPKRQPDLLITTNLLPDFKNTPYPVITISDAFTIKDLVRIMRAIY